MDNHSHVLTKRAREQRKRLQEMRDVAIAGVEHLFRELDAAETQGDTRRAQEIVVDIETIAEWLAWLARGEVGGPTTPRVPGREAGDATG